MDELKAVCQEYLDWLASDDYEEDEVSKYEQEILSKAMRVCCGEDVWDRVNALILEQDRKQFDERNKEHIRHLEEELARLKKMV